MKQNLNFRQGNEVCGVGGGGGGHPIGELKQMN